MGKKRLIITIFLTLILVLTLSPLYSNLLLRGAYESRHINKTMRVDIHNRGGKHNSLKLLSQHESNMPDWCKGNSGSCAVIQDKIKSKWKEYKVSLKAIKDGKIEIYLRGPDRRVENQRYPVIVDYRHLMVNGKLLFHRQQRVWHDKPFSYQLKVKDGEVVNVSFWARKHHFKISDITNIYQTDLLLLFALTVLSFLLSYKLVQYVAKFKLLELRSRIDIVFLAFLAVCLYLPMSNISQLEKSTQENRMLAKKPVFLNKNGINLRYGEQFEKWFNDRFWGRKLLIKIHTNILLCINKYYRNGKALLFAENGWMFNFPINLNSPSKELTLQIIDNIQKFDSWCAENNIKFYLNIVPKKESIYKNILKDFSYDSDKEERFHRFIEKIISTIGKDKIIYSYDELADAAKDDYVFFKAAHHWTDFGAYIGYRKLMDAISKDFSDVNIVNIDDYNVSYSTDIRDDYNRKFNKGHTTRLLNISNDYATSHILKTKYTYYDYPDFKNTVYTQGKYIKTFSRSSGKYKIFVTGNSQNEDLLQFLPYSAKNLKYLRLNMGQVKETEQFKFMKLYKKEVLDFQPDILVLTISENIIPALVNLFKD